MKIVVWDLLLGASPSVSLRVFLNCYLIPTFMDSGQSASSLSEQIRPLPSY